jgi:hypothetical protein
MLNLLQDDIKCQWQDNCGGVEDEIECFR